MTQRTLRTTNMPFESKAQARYMYAVKPELAKEFAQKTASMKSLPEHVQKKKRDKPPIPRLA